MRIEKLMGVRMRAPFASLEVMEVQAGSTITDDTGAVTVIREDEAVIHGNVILATPLVAEALLMTTRGDDDEERSHSEPREDAAASIGAAHPRNRHLPQAAEGPFLTDPDTEFSQPWDGEALTPMEVHELWLQRQP
jgi:hypothetical protein